jgi:uncharacterized protein (TIGR02118 family)
MIDDDSPQMLSRRGILGVASLLAAASTFPLLAAPEPADRGLKIVSTIARKDGMSHEAFVQHWMDVHAKLAESVPGVKGFIASEILPSAGGVSNPVLGDLDGIASVWYQDRPSIAATLASPAGHAWIADGNSFIERTKSHNFFTREHVIVPIQRRTGAIKRTLFLVRASHVTHAQFMDHWLNVHAKLAQNVPGVAGCIFTELEPAAVGQDPAAAGIDGISESWWEGPGTETGGKIASPEASRWAADGDNFLDNARSRLILSREHVFVAPPA